MRKLFSSRRRFIGLGLMSAIFVALAVVGVLWGFSQNTSAGAPPVTLVHVNPDGTDYTGNPVCPDTTWVSGRPTVNPAHDCNNITSQNHVIRTANWDPAAYSRPLWTVSGPVSEPATIVPPSPTRCGDLTEVTGRPNWDAPCLNKADDDGDTRINDGCAAKGAAGETACTETSCADADGVPPWDTCDDDNDGFINDGCAAYLVTSESLNDQQCIVLHSNVPGETRVEFNYSPCVVGQTCASPAAVSVVKEWDSLIDSHILKTGDLESVTVSILGGGTKTMSLPKDMNGDGRRDAEDERLLDKQSGWQDHGVILDESTKRIRSSPPVQIIEVVHGGHNVLINSVTVPVHQATEGAVILATIDSPRGCTFFTNSTGVRNFGQRMNGVSNGQGHFVGPQVAPAVTMPAGLSLNPASHMGPYPPDGAPAISAQCLEANGIAGCQVGEGWGIENIYVDTVCEEQAKIVIRIGYPDSPGSLRVPVDEWVGINWTTVELAKQPQIRWAGEEIVLAKRWAPDGTWYPNLAVAPATGLQVPCPLATMPPPAGGAVLTTSTAVTHHVNYVLLDPGLGALEGAYVDKNGDGVLDTLSFMGQSEAVGDIDAMCISKGLGGSEDPGEQDIEAKLMEDTYYCPPIVFIVGYPAVPGTISYDSGEGRWACSYAGQSGIAPAATLISSVLINKQAFLVYYLKIYQVKLTNVDGEREFHNDGKWNQGDGVDTEEDTLNVSQDALLRVKVKGWFYSADKSAHGAVCIDMDGDGNGVDDDGDTKVGEDKLDNVDNDGDTKTDEDLELGVPYPVTNEDVGCPDAADQMLENGYWVLPDDLPTLAGPEPMYTRPNWDVMSEPDASSTAAVGPKSSLDSHDPVARPWIPCLPGVCFRKTIVPDGAITAADAIMPPLKIRAGLAGESADVLAEDLVGFLKGASKGNDIDIGTNDYHSIMIPADAEIPPFTSGDGGLQGGYDWDSWFCRVEDANVKSPQDTDGDGVADAVDNCWAKVNPNQYDLDVDCAAPPYLTDPKCGDACDSNIDGDIDANADDPCDYNPLVTSAAPGTDGDGDTTPDSCDLDAADVTVKDEDADRDGVKDTSDNCPRNSNTSQTDSDKDGAGDVCDPLPFTKLVASIISCPTGLRGLALGPYEFWTILNKREREASKETEPSLKKAPWYIEFYTDNRGEGMFFANGDFNLFKDRSLDECGTDLVSGAPDCRLDDVVGESDIKVIGDYPYFRKHSAVQSNLVTKTWTWGGFKDIEGIRIDANHTAIIAHLLDRDGYCKWNVGSDPTKAKSVQFSPSLHPVQGEEIEFVLNSADGAIVGVSPYAEYSPTPADSPCPWDIPHCPLYKSNVTALKDVAIISRDEAVAVAEDGRVLDYYNEARGIDEEKVAEEDCQAWIVVEHPLGVVPDVSIFLHDPEGDITRHWPPADVTVPLVQNWNDSCYVGEEATIEEAMADIIDDVAAIYRYNADQTWDQYFPGRCEEVENLCTFDTLMPYDQLFILMTNPIEWVVGPIAAGAAADNKDAQVELAGAKASDSVPGAWNSVCYAGVDKLAEDAVKGISTGLAIMYQLGTDQMWRYYVPGRDEIGDTLTTLHPYDSVLLLITAEGGVTWKFDP